MKRMFCVLLALSMLVLLVGCGGSTENDDEPATADAGIEEEEVNEEEIMVENSTDEVESIVYANLIPDPEVYFADGEILIVDADGGTQYYFRVTNYYEGEYEAYVDECKTMGFTDISYELESEGGKMFGAYTEDGLYHIDVSMGYSIDAIDVICKSVVEEEEHSEASTDEVEDISYADIIPDPEEYFADGKVFILDPDGGTMYMLYITDYQDGEYEAYVEACQTIGFTEVSYEIDSEGGKMYGAYTKDGVYFLDITLGYDIEAITITCQSVSND